MSDLKANTAEILPNLMEINSAYQTVWNFGRKVSGLKGIAQDALKEVETTLNSQANEYTSDEDKLSYQMATWLLSKLSLRMKIKHYCKKTT